MNKNINSLLSILVLLTGFCVDVAAQNNEDKPKHYVSRGYFSTAIVDREPSDQVLILTNNIVEIYFFTDLRHFQGQTITHRWEYEGKKISEKTFEVGGARWRVSSKRMLDPTMLGEWSVVVTDGKDWPVYAAKFEYIDYKAGVDSNAAILPPD